MICVEQGGSPWDLKMFDTVQKKKKGNNSDSRQLRLYI